ncbi:hypothetical protein [Roseiconus lacunae]|uniref:hypothetical protein n=1 Tax=Roseiconus lacunae TaxID=2605694 RepID=UPI001E613BBB|nr:hypothetical protein [Roseiconus lacunae]MCD0459937.1 hypothetical protein [Roseiconus lacunae]
MSVIKESAHPTLADCEAAISRFAEASSALNAIADALAPTLSHDDADRLSGSIDDIMCDFSAWSILIRRANATMPDEYRADPIGESSGT